MGYRSDVGLFMGAYTAEDYAVVKVWFDNYRQRLDEWWHPHESYFMEVVCDHLLGIRFLTEDVRWYESYKDVAIIEQLYDDFEQVFMGMEMEGKYALQFIRIGEETTDIEERCPSPGFNYFYVERSIGEEQ